LYRDPDSVETEAEGQGAEGAAAALPAPGVEVAAVREPTKITAQKFNYIRVSLEILFCVLI
jgi:hypothetical protein